MRPASLIKAGDSKLLINGHPPKVDCRVVADENYLDIVNTFKEIRSLDIKRYLNGKSELLPKEVREKIHNFLLDNGVE